MFRKLIKTGAQVDGVHDAQRLPHLVPGSLLAQAATRLEKDARVSSTLETVLKIGKISLQ